MLTKNKLKSTSQLISLKSSSVDNLWSVENGKIKSILSKPSGLSKMANSINIKENTFTSMSKNGKIKHPGGVLPSKENLKLILKKSTLNLRNYLISMDKRDPLSRKWCSIWDKSSKGSQLLMSFKRGEKCRNSWKPIHKWISLNVSLDEQNLFDSCVNYFCLVMLEFKY